MLETTADDALGLLLLNDCQRNFPLCPAPFAELAGRLGVGEGDLLRRLTRLRREGRIVRVGAVFAPKRIGASTLVAMAVPALRLAAVIETVGRFPEVNHVVVREHHYNLWFVVTAGGEGRLAAALTAIEAASGHAVLRLPLLGDLRTARGGPGEVGESGVRLDNALHSPVPTALDEIGRRLVMALQEGLPLLVRPFAVLASRVGCEEGEVIQRIRAWSAAGVIKRFGVVVRSGPRAGHAPAQALWVLDVPDGDVGALAGRLAAEPALLLCYLRPRVLPEWPYNVFCVLGGESRAAVAASVAMLSEDLGLSIYAQAVLHDLGHTPLTGAPLT